MVGLAALAPSVIVQATVDDLVVALVAMCVTTPFDIDNTSLCGTICGDCNDNGMGPDIIDALTSAQFAAGLSMPTMTQMGCCDVNNDGSITVLDALLMAQTAAGLVVTLVCP
jgi:hypothetical protein